MPATRLPVRKIQEILRLRFANRLSHRDIAKSCNVSPSTVGDMLARCERAGVSWPLDSGLSDAELEAKLYRKQEDLPEEPRPAPNWEAVHRELRRRDFHVSRHQVWMEYRQANPDGYEYSWFCQEYAEWLKRIEPVMRQTHVFGEKCFVDYAGDTVPVVDPRTGEVEQAQIFVAAMGASNYTYAEASPQQSLPYWIAAHVNMLRYFGACPKVLVPDNLRSGVKRPEFYEPDINPTYHEMAQHYGMAVIPTRKAKPRDKAKVENAVLVAERELLAPLRNRTFYSFSELNEALGERRDELNCRPFQKLPGSRNEVFDRDDKPAMLALPATAYDGGIWKPARVNLDYHVEVEGHYYSVPYRLIRQPVEVRITATMVEVLHDGRRVASHRRSHLRGRPTTCPEHMPANHRAVHDWTPQRMLDWGASIGTSTTEAVRQLMACRDHPEQGVRSCLGLLNLKKPYGSARLEKACTRALTAGPVYSYKSVKSILEKGLDQVPVPPPPRITGAGAHENVRGGDYYNNAGGDRC